MRRRSCLLSLALLAHYLGTVATVSAHNPANHISRVSLLFACHLDVGFHSGGTEPGYDNVVISRYFNQYFPAAAQLGQQLRNRPGGTERLAFLTHSWLVSLFLNCPARIGITCPNSTTVDQFRAAVHHGDIVWHALPHNAQVELYDDSLLRFGVRMTHDVDRAFGLPPKVTMSQRDVPGLTRAAVPILVDEGVKAISVGVNGGSAPPGVPKNTPFIWRDPPSGKQLLAMWHPGGYSGFPVDDRDECVQVKGFPHALCFAWSGDNTGPPSLEEVLAIFSKVRKDFPKARVEAAGFDGFVSELEAAAPKLHLPVVTAEIGDTWIHGAAADPAKLSEYRALLRMRRASRERYGDEAFNRFSRLLLKLPEHTGGVDSKEYPGEWESWNNADLKKRLADKRLDNPFIVAVSSWVRQRAYSLWAVQELGSSEAGLAAWQALAALQDGKAAPTPDAVNSSFKRCDMQRPLVFESDSWQLEVSNMTGAIVGLRFKAGSASDTSSGGSSRSKGGLQPSRYGSSGSRPSLWTRIVGALGWPGGSLSVSSGSGVGKSWAGFDAPLALPVYSTYAEDDYDAIWDSYSYFPRDKLADWFYKDFGKPNSTVKGGARRAEYLPQAQRVWWRRTTGGGLHVTIKATFDSYAVQFAGAPKALWTEIRAPAGSPDLQLDVTWEDKTATRLPEAFWLRWAPRSDAVNASSWLMYKLGQPISPLEVMLNGSHALHAVGDEGVSVDSADGSQRLYIRSLDAAVVSPGRHTPFPVLSAAPDLRYGMSYLAAANIWGTNYAQWFPYAAGDATMRFRFVLQVKGKSSTASVEAA